MMMATTRSVNDKYIAKDDLLLLYISAFCKLAMNSLAAEGQVQMNLRPSLRLQRLVF